MQTVPSRRPSLGCHILRCILGLAFGSALLLTSSGVRAQSFDGTYAGTLSCPAPPGGGSPFRADLTMTVSGGTATFERPIMRIIRGKNAPEPTGKYERGGGTVTPSGEVVLRGTCDGGLTCATEYRGQLSANPIRFVGIQRFPAPGRPDSERSCQIDLTRKQ
jgi:hypothetical protein